MPSEDYYALLGLDLEATEQAIRKAYRLTSLKVHPDRNPDNPNAAALFHDLTVAYETLVDPVARTKYDAKIRLDREREERFGKLDNERKRMREELERDEEAARNGIIRGKKGPAGVDLNEIQRLKEESRKLKERIMKKRANGNTSSSTLNPEKSKEKKTKPKSSNVSSEPAAKGGFNSFPTTPLFGGEEQTMERLRKLERGKQEAREKEQERLLERKRIIEEMRAEDASTGAM